MAFGLFGNGVSVIKFFEIRLDQDVIILRGTADEASSGLLRGTVVLCLAEPLSVKKIQLRFQGTSRLGCPEFGQTRVSRAKVLREESPFFKKEFVFVNTQKIKNEIIPAGNYEYSFEVVIPGDTPESVEGLGESWIIYRLKATIDRGRLAQNHYARKHLRVVRTFDPSALELAHEMWIENIWVDKVEYTISVPNKACIFGTSINTELKMIPLVKGLKMDSVQITLNEGQDYTLSARSHKFGRQIYSTKFPIEDEVQTLDDEGHEGWLVKKSIPLPSTLSKCVQDVEAMGIRIRHKLRFVIQLTNPDGHLSEIRAVLPVHIYLSPHLMVDERNQLVNQAPSNAQALHQMDHHAPPVYGEHQFDQLWSEIDPSGYLTPADIASGVSTPLQARSRNTSAENLGSITALSQTFPGAIPPQILQNRLSNLPDAASSRRLLSTPGNLTPRNLQRGLSEEDSPVGQTPPLSGEEANSLARHISTEERAESPFHQPEHIEFDSENLSKVPSYHTAVRAPVGISYSGDLPNYEAATSSPSRSPFEASQAHDPVGFEVQAASRTRLMPIAR